MTLRQKRYLSLALMACGIFLMFLLRKDIAGIALLAAGFVWNITMVHCPKCNEWIEQHPGEFCRYCGAKIDWDGKKE